MRGFPARVAWIVAVLLLLVSGAVEAHTAEECASWVTSGGTTGGLPAGWHLVEALPEEARILYTFKHERGLELKVVVEPRNLGRSFYAATKNLNISYLDPGIEKGNETKKEIDELMKHIVSALRENDKGQIFAAKGDDVPCSDERALALLGGSGAVLGLPEGWTFRLLERQEDKVIFTFAAPEGALLRLYLAPAGSNHSAYATTVSYKIWYSIDESYPNDDESLQELDSVLHTLVGVIRDNDTGQSVFDAGLGGDVMVPPAGLVGPAELLVRLDFLLYALLLASLVALFMVQVREIRTWSRNEKLGVMGLTALSALVRVLVVPHVLVKVGMVHPLMSASIALENLPRYGAAGPTLYHILFQVLPTHTDTILWFHTAVSLANAVMAIVFLRRHLKLEGAVVGLALFLCLTPVFLRDGNSESLLVPGTFLLLSGGILFSRFFDDCRKRWLFLAVPPLALTLHLRPEFLLVTPLFLTVVAVPRFQRERRMAWLVAPVVLLAFLAIPYVQFLTSAMEIEMSRGNFEQGKLSVIHSLVRLFQDNMLLSPKVFPFAVGLLALTGLVLSLVLKRDRLRLVPLFGFATAWYGVYYMDFNPESMLRLHVPGSLFFSGVASWAVATLHRLAGTRRIKDSVALLVAVAFVSTAAYNSFFVFFRTNYHTQDRWFDEVVAALPEEPVTFVVLTGNDEPTRAFSESTFATAPPGAEGMAPVHRYYPTWQLQPPLRNDSVVSIRQWSLTPTRDTRRAFFFLSTQCYAIREEHGAELWGIPATSDVPMHPACRWMLLKHQLKPIIAVRIPNLSEYSPPFKWYPDTLTDMVIGLFEVEGRIDASPSRDVFAQVANYYFARAKEHLLKKELDAAQRILEEAEALLANDSTTLLAHLGAFHFLAGATRDDQASVEKSLEYWLRVAAKDIRFPSLLKNIGSVFSVLSKYLGTTGATKLVDDRLRTDPNDLIGLWLKGMLLFYNEKDYLASLSYLERVLKVIDDDPRIYVYFALDHYYLGHQEEAERWIEKGIQVGKGTDPDAYYVRSIIVRRKNLPLAIEDIQRYLDMCQGDDKVKLDAKQKWLKQELENLRAGRPSDWWNSRIPAEPWKEPADGKGSGPAAAP